VVVGHRCHYQRREFVDKLKLPFPVLTDTAHGVIDAYDLFKPDGKIATCDGLFR
jgi:peroxiredoxin